MFLDKIWRYSYNSSKTARNDCRSDKKDDDIGKKFKVNPRIYKKIDEIYKILFHGQINFKSARPSIQLDSKWPRNLIQHAKKLRYQKNSQNPKREQMCQ